MKKLLGLIALLFPLSTHAVDKKIYSPSGNLVLDTAAASDLKINTAGSTKMTVKSDGKVGIGSTSPSEKLDVNGSINLATGNGLKINGTTVLNATSYTGNCATATSATTASSATTAGTVTNGVYTTGNQSIDGTKTFTGTINGSITGNAGTVTNGVYTSGDQTIGGIKTFTSSPLIKGRTDGAGDYLASPAGMAGYIGEYYADVFSNSFSTTQGDTLFGQKTLSAGVWEVTLVANPSTNASWGGEAINYRISSPSYAGKDGVDYCSTAKIVASSYGSCTLHKIFSFNTSTTIDFRVSVTRTAGTIGSNGGIYYKRIQ